MRFTRLHNPDLVLVEPTVFADERGFLMETWRADFFASEGLPSVFVQDNHSRSVRGVLRGLHYQIKQPQGKLVRVTRGSVFDVAVDLRVSSTHFGQYVSVILSADNKRGLWIPPGFAHGFFVLSEVAEFAYKCTDYYAPEYERCLLWNDPDIAIQWPLSDRQPQISVKDAAGQRLHEVEGYD